MTEKAKSSNVTLEIRLTSHILLPLSGQEKGLGARIYLCNVTLIIRLSISSVHRSLKLN